MGDIVVLGEQSEVPTRTRHEPFGRPTLYTHELGEAICDHIAKGMTKRGACGLVGVNEETFRTWFERDDFSQMLLRAEATAEQFFTDVLVKAAGGTQGQADYRAGVEWLKRRRRAEYGDSLDIRKIDTEQLRDLLLAATAGTSQPADETQPALVPGDDAI